MLLNARSLKGYDVDGSDGPVGTVIDSYFDDERWVLRYLVIDTREWIRGREVLVSPLAVQHVDAEREKVTLSLTRHQVDNSPSPEADEPVSRVMEAKLNRYFGYPDYWAFGAVAPLWGWGDLPVMPASSPREAVEQELGDAETHLRSTDEVLGYHIRTRDETFGHLEDMLFEPDSWAIRYLLVDTRNWWPGPPVLVGTNWVDRIDWSERTLTFDTTADRIKHSPAYVPAAPVSRDYEENLHRHYQRPIYWRQ